MAGAAITQIFVPGARISQANTTWSDFVAVGPTDVVQSIGWEDGQLTIFSRVQGNAGTNITQAGITSIACRVYDLDNSNALVASPAVVVASVVFDALQTAAPWVADTTGYNVKFAVPAASFPTGGRRYRIELTFTPVSSGDPFYVITHHQTKTRLGA